MNPSFGVSYLSFTLFGHFGFIDIYKSNFNVNVFSCMRSKFEKVKQFDDRNLTY